MTQGSPSPSATARPPTLGQPLLFPPAPAHRADRAVVGSVALDAAWRSSRRPAAMETHRSSRHGRQELDALDPDLERSALIQRTPSQYEPHRIRHVPTGPLAYGQSTIHTIWQGSAMSAFSRRSLLAGSAGVAAAGALGGPASAKPTPGSPIDRRRIHRWATDTWASLVAMTDETTGLTADNIGRSVRNPERSGYTSPTNIGGLPLEHDRRARPWPDQPG